MNYELLGRFKYEYETERCNMNFIISEYGFLGYRMSDDNQIALLADLYVPLKFRGTKFGYQLADDFAKKAKENGARILQCEISFYPKNFEQMMKYAKNYGFKELERDDNRVLLIKEI